MSLFSRCTYFYTFPHFYLIFFLSRKQSHTPVFQFKRVKCEKYTRSRYTPISMHLHINYINYWVIISFMMHHGRMDIKIYLRKYELVQSTSNRLIRVTDTAF